MEFFGTLSLANNGGFASVRTKPKKLDLANGDTLVARVRGDGREYMLIFTPHGHRLLTLIAQQLRRKRTNGLK